MDTNKNARYEGNWYFCWLIERRDRKQLQYWNGDFWTAVANDALWFARHCDAENIVYAYTHWGKPKDVVICEHGFQITQDIASTVVHADEDAGCEGNP